MNNQDKNDIINKMCMAFDNRYGNVSENDGETSLSIETMNQIYFAMERVYCALYEGNKNV